MHRHHEDELTRRLEELCDRGATKIEWYELYRWYEAKRLGNRSWADLQQRAQGFGVTNVRVMDYADGVLLVDSGRFEKLGDRT